MVGEVILLVFALVFVCFVFVPEIGSLDWIGSGIGLRLR